MKLTSSVFSENVNALFVQTCEPMCAMDLYECVLQCMNVLHNRLCV